MEYLIKVKNPYVNVYRDSSKDSIVGLTYGGYQTNVTEVSPDKQYYYAPSYGGWIAAENITIVQNTTSPIDNETIIPVPITRTTDILAEQKLTTGMNDSSTSVLAGLAATDLGGIFAMPYQFMPSVDRRLGDNENGVGRKYAEKIAARGNLLYLTPGKQTFMPGVSASQRSSVLGALFDDSGYGPSEVNTIIERDSRYYGFENDWKTYFKYVNIACTSTATLMGIEEVEVTVGTQGKRPIKSIDWSQARPSDARFNTMLGLNENLLFYVDGLNSISDSYSNNTRESSLVSMINGPSDLAKEINFITNFGNDKSMIAALANEDEYRSTFSEIQSTIDQFTSGTGVLNAVLGNYTTVLSGGKLIFPEIWNDSDYDRSYSIDIKLRSPEADDVSIFLNIIVPLIHLMALTAPRDFDGTANSNGYVAPFLVRAFFRSLFNVELGIITDLSVNKGGEGNWAATTNLPTSVDVSITIKDLYKSMYMTGMGMDDIGYAKLLSNDAEMEQLMTLAGVSSNILLPSDKINLASSLVNNKLTNVINRGLTSLFNDASNVLARQGWISRY